MPNANDRLIRLPATALSRMLTHEEISSLELTRAVLDRIDAQDGRIRAFTTVLRERALADAARADEERRKGRSRGPLHGMPVSVKESIEMAGHASTLGVTARVSKVATSDAALVKMLREAGAVIVGRTNVSQLLLYHEARNPVFGQTANPFSAAHSPGGSSGGEAAALAAGMSMLGIGGDIGGSIRGPAHASGIVGLKPTLDRWPTQGSLTGLMGQEAIRGQTGPMGRTVGDVTMLMGALDARRMSALDGRVPPLEWEDPARIDVPRLRVGFYTDDGVLSASRAVVRGVERATDVLRNAGCEVVPFTPPQALEMIFTYAAAMSSDAGAMGMAAIGKGEVDPTLSALLRIARLPDAVRAAVAGVMSMRGEHVASGILRALGRKPVETFWALTGKIRAYRFAFTDALDRAGIDVLLCPVHATPALPHGASKDFAFAGSYSMLYNLLQFPAGSVPVTTVRADETQRTNPRERMERMAAEVDRVSKGLPIGVQVVGRPWAEATVLAVMAEIERGVQGDDGFPVTPVG